MTFFLSLGHNPHSRAASGNLRSALLWEATRRFGEAYETLYVQWLDDTIHLVEERF